MKDGKKKSIHRGCGGEVKIVLYGECQVCGEKWHGAPYNTAFLRDVEIPRGEPHIAPNALEDYEVEQ